MSCLHSQTTMPSHERIFELNFKNLNNKVDSVTDQNVNSPDVHSSKKSLLET